MLIAKLQGVPFETELHLPKFERVNPAHALKDPASSKIGLVTDGGLVPKGNPDKIESSSATKYGRYSIEDYDQLQPDDYEVVHVGYDNNAVKQNPNRLIPLDIMREMEQEGIINQVDRFFYSSTGVGTDLNNSAKIGKAIAEQLKSDRVNAAILTST